jgi:hypothetical protein
MLRRIPLSARSVRLKAPIRSGVPTNDGVQQAVPWEYRTASYVPQGYPLARTVQFSLRYNF